ncbi:MAG: hypothetical protein NTW01_04090 [Gammaproteobacteria bacterium]|uniref:hypothetical protein n=1 Tax=Nevskia sp. TaxID=1929292 RepID=UPI004035AAB8|nr:hypothetical protein [Gammaproteobacteria bacterium]
MKKLVLITALAASSVLAPAQAAPANGLGQTLAAVLQRPVGTVTDIVRGYPAITQELAPIGVDLLLVVPSLLRGEPVTRNIRTVTVALPGPAFLNQNIVNIPDTLRVNVAASGPLVITVGTGGR